LTARTLQVILAWGMMRTYRKSRLVTIGQPQVELARITKMIAKNAREQAALQKRHQSRRLRQLRKDMAELQERLPGIQARSDKRAKKYGRLWHVAGGSARTARTGHLMRSRGPFTNSGFIAGWYGTPQKRTVCGLPAWPLSGGVVSEYKGGPVACKRCYQLVGRPKAELKAEPVLVVNGQPTATDAEIVQRSGRQRRAAGNCT
jgi:hypothetical protein